MLEAVTFERAGKVWAAADRRSRLLAFEHAGFAHAYTAAAWSDLVRQVPAEATRLAVVLTRADWPRIVADDRRDALARSYHAC